MTTEGWRFEEASRGSLFRGAATVTSLSENSRRRWLAVFGLALLGLMLRLTALSESLWIDELHTAWVAGGPWDELPQRAALGNQTPWFFAIEWLLVQLFGPHDWLLRCPSVAFSLAAAVSVFCLVEKRVGSSRWALLVTGISVADSHMIFFGTEARPYAAVLLMAVWHAGALVGWWSKSGSWKAGLAWIVTGVAMLQLHWSAAWYLVWEAACLLAVSLGKPEFPQRSRWIVLEIVAITATSFVSFDSLAWIARRWDQWAVLERPSSIWQLVDALHLGWYLGAVAVAWAAALAARFRALDTRAAPSPNFLCLWLVPVVAAWALAQLHVIPVFLPRYFIAVVPAAWLALAQLGLQVDRLDVRWPARLSAAGLLGVLVFLNLPLWVHLARQGVWRNEGWREALAFLEKQYRPDEPLLLRSGLLEAEQLPDVPSSNPGLWPYWSYPLRTFYSSRLSSAQIFLLDNSPQPKLDRAVRERLQRADRLWLLARSEPEFLERLTAWLTAELDGQSWSVTAFHFGRVHVVRIQKPVEAVTLRGREPLPSSGGNVPTEQPGF
ncbi:MAG: hypothetical protein KatS3mg110_1272 [Pirellulaceae bacterium]|nr:MAG: hypothetical protein KatS3mg110_1272 [Pirellulaceae bacterium]